MTTERRDDDLTLGPAGDFMRRLWRLSHAMERVSKQMEARLGVTSQQRMLIRCVGKYPGLTAGQLASLLHLDAGTVSTTLGRLEAKGLLVRRRDARDARRVSLGLTSAGRALDAAREGTVERLVELALRASPEEDLEATTRVLAHLAERLEGALERE